jgi:hypothetical protein
MKRIAAIICMALLAAGCAVTRPQPRIDPGILDRDSFLSWLADQPLVSAAEAYRAMLIAATDQDPGSDFLRNQQEVFRRDIARPEWKLQPDQAVDKATVSFMVAQIAKVPGGINLNLFGRALHLSDRRYAYRELVYEGFSQDSGTPNMVLTGGEFVSFLTWADERREKSGEPALPTAPAVSPVYPSTTQPQSQPAGQPPAP